MHQPRLILVTGAPRSGTTVVGELLSSAPATGELYEPMNAAVGDPAIKNQFEVPGSADFSAADCDRFIDRVERRKLRPRKAASGRRNPYLNRTNRTIVLDRLSPVRRTTVWKDPFAFFLAPRVAARGNIPVIVTLRDPLSLAGSFKRMNWIAPVAGLATRMGEAGLRVDDGVLKAAMAAEGPVGTGSVLWHLYHRTLKQWLDEGLNILPVTVTDLLDSPRETAERLGAHCGLAILPPVQPVANVSDLDAALPDKAHVKNRSAASVTEYWKRILDDEEVAYCRGLNGELWGELAVSMAKSGANLNG